MRVGGLPKGPTKSSFCLPLSVSGRTHMEHRQHILLSEERTHIGWVNNQWNLWSWPHLVDGVASPSIR